MKKLLIFTMLILNSLYLHVEGAAPFYPLDENIFKLVQTTPRAKYYFNESVIKFKTNQEGFIDPNIVIVPTVKILDNTEIEDIVMKKQWKDESIYRFNELSSVAEYVEINLVNNDVVFIKNEYLDRGYNPFDKPYKKDNISLDNLSKENVNYIFYTYIADFVKNHKKDILKKMLKEGYKLTPEELKDYNLTKDGEDIKVDEKPKSKKKEKKK